VPTLKDLISALLKEPRGRAGLLVFVVLSALVYLAFALFSERGALSRLETLGMLLFMLILVSVGSMTYNRFRKK
jgi:hypothetical protein